MSVKGYAAQSRLSRTRPDHATVEKVREEQYGLTVNASVYVTNLGSDAVEAGSTVAIVNATAHAAKVGDVVIFTSGNLSGQEIKVDEVSANTITLAQDLSEAPAGADTFEVLRPKYPVVAADGSISVTTTPGPLLFTLNGSDQEVTEDTVTPANNNPLPVKLVDMTGDITVTANELNVHNDAAGANPDSIRVGDGTNELAMTGAGEATVSVTQPLPAGTNNIGDVDIASSALPSGAATEATLLTIDADTSALAGTVSGSELQVDIITSALPTGAATEATLLTIDADTGSIATDASTIAGAVSGTEMQVDIVTSALPAGAATEATLLTIDADTGSIDTKTPALGQALKAASVPVVLASDSDALPVSAATLDVVDFLDTALLDAGSTTINGNAGAFISVVASLSSDVKKVQFIDTTGGFIGLYSDPLGTPLLQVIIGPGSDQTIEVDLPLGTELGLRSLQAAAITEGQLCINFIG